MGGNFDQIRAWGKVHVHFQYRIEKVTDIHRPWNSRNGAKNRNQKILSINRQASDLFILIM